MELNSSILRGSPMPNQLDQYRAQLEKQSV
jgi:hypothetical protein